MAFFRKRSRKPKLQRRRMKPHDPDVDGIAPTKSTLGKYGITAEQYIVMYDAQDGKCYICRRPPRTRRLAIDHDHSNPNKIRGLLCAHCNYGLGYFKDNVEHLRLACEYLGRTAPITVEPKTVDWNTTRLEMPDEYYVPGRDRYACAFPETKEYDEYNAADGDPE